MLRYFVKHRVQIVLGLLLTFFAIWLQTTSQGLVRGLLGRLDYLAYDVRLNQTLPPPIETPRVYIIDIDEESLRAEASHTNPSDTLSAPLVITVSSLLFYIRSPGAAEGGAGRTLPLR